MEQMIDSTLVQQLRKEKSWTQDQLARVSGISLRTIQRIEKKGACSLETIQALASVFEVEPGALHKKTGTEETEYQQNQFWDRAWNGGLPLSRAVGLVWLCALPLFTALYILLIITGLTGLGAAMFMAPVMAVHALFSFNCIWRSSPRKTTSFPAVFSRLAIALYSIYVLYFAFKIMF